MKIKIIITLISLLFSTQITLADWLTDQAYNFKINIPYGWNINSYMDDGDKVHEFTSPDQNIFLQIRCFDNGGADANQIAQLFEDGLVSEGAERHDLSNDELNGLAGVMGVYTNNFDGTDMGIVSFTATHNKLAYLMFVVVPVAQFDQKANEVDGVLNTFTLLSTANPIAQQNNQQTQQNNQMGGVIGGATANTGNQQSGRIGNQQSGNAIGSGSSGSANPCTGSRTLDYMGQTYKVVQIGNQCWFAENLNVGTMIPSTHYAKDNDIIEKKCKDDNEANCRKYGGFYTWNEAMKYDKSGSLQGICPPGWHVPTDDEWKMLEGYVDSEFRYGDPTWDKTDGSRGKDAATKLKSTSGWGQNPYSKQPGIQGTNQVGFNAIPTGCFNNDNHYGFEDIFTRFWTSTKNEAWGQLATHRSLTCYSHHPERNYNKMHKGNQFSIRCVRD